MLQNTSGIIYTNIVETRFRIRVLLYMITFLEHASEYEWYYLYEHCRNALPSTGVIVYDYFPGMRFRMWVYYLYEHCRNALQNASIIIYTNVVETRFRVRVLLYMITFLECASECGCYYLYERCRNAL